jgi:hypothetical protein
MILRIVLLGVIKLSVRRVEWILPGDVSSHSFLASTTLAISSMSVSRTRPDADLLLLNSQCFGHHNDEKELI